ncbi:hypothetical protein [Pelagibius sp.]|uniref:hypothetical protein n=2 Tax=Pelagibius sp. TaxID=1931238 RepID=UPI003BAFCB56
MTMARWKNTKGNSALLDPEESCLLFIDFGGTVPGLRSDPPTIGPAHCAVLTKAVDLSVPAFLSYMGAEDAAGLHSPLSQLVPEEAQLRRSVVNPCRDDRHWETVSALKRHCLILAGGWPEGSLAQAALDALGEAYDVYVLFDLSNGLLDVHNSPVAARLIQAGVVPMTASQLILEWGDSETLDPPSEE